MTPHDLINMPYAGQAKRQLVKQKQWDEYAGMTSREFCVHMEATITVDDNLIVKARHEDEAEEMAVKKFASLHNCDEADIEVTQILDSSEE